MCGFPSRCVKYIKIKLSINVKILINFLLKKYRKHIKFV